MHHFEYREGRLFAEGVAVEDLAARFGTPFYCYSAATLRRHIRVFQEAFASCDALVAYAVKANSNLAVLSLMAKEGAGADIVSGGELARALKAGIAPQKIVFSGVGKTRDELIAALDAGIYQFNVESAPELEALNSVAIARGEKAPIALRVNPDVAAGGHDKISTGKREDKFGVAWSEARGLYARAREMEGIAVKGVDVHIGSQIADLKPFETAFRKVAGLIADLRADGCTIERLDLGGGLGISYGDQPDAPPHPDAYAAMIKRVTAPLDVQLIFEPGRMIVGNAGILVSRIVYVKTGEARQFAIIDAGMNDLIRPALYDAFHDVLPVREAGAGDEPREYDVVGPVCESSDTFAKARAIAPLAAGDLVAIMSAGAYGAVQSSQYNTRPLTPEILVDGENAAAIRRRPSVDDILAQDTVPDWIKSPAK